MKNKRQGKTSETCCRTLQIFYTAYWVSRKSLHIFSCIEEAVAEVCAHNNTNIRKILI